MAFKKTLGKNSEYTISYSDMRGVDFSTGSRGSQRHRFPYLENMYRDYESGNMNLIESIPGFRRIAGLEKKIHSFFCQKDSKGDRYIIVHSGDSLFRFPLDSRDSLVSGLTPIATVADNKSHGFNWGCELYILDGVNIIRIADDGTAAVVDDYNAIPYIPTTYKNGVEIEQRNLLTRKFHEIFTIVSVDDYAYGSRGLKYKILSVTDKTAAVTGWSYSEETVIYIPSYVTISGEKYAVVEIADNAFLDNSDITEVHMSSKQLRIGKRAFYGCTVLKKIITSDFIEEIDDQAFANCPLLDTLFLGVGLKKIGTEIVKSSLALYTIDYGGTPDNYIAIENRQEINHLFINDRQSYTTIKIAIPVSSPAEIIDSLRMNGRGLDYTARTGENGLMNEVILEPDDKFNLDGKTVTITGRLHPSMLSKGSPGAHVLSTENVDTVAAINGCTLCECYDGRVFLSGNPAFPNTVFYSSRDIDGKNNPLYFGALNYFNDGTGSYSVKSLLTTSEGLVVFKEGDDGGGSIFYHTPYETGLDTLPKIYPVSYIHSGTCAIGDSISFFDDPVFISALGVSGLEKKNLNLERSISTRSHNVNAHLFGNDLSKASLAKWCGYLVVCCGEKIYLADSRDTFRHPSGSTEYEWYFLNNIGTYTNGKRVYCFSAVSDFYPLYDTPDKPIDTPYFGSYDDGVVHYYTMVGDNRYSIYRTEEWTGGDFSPACSVFATSDNILFFGTESGDVCVFNNDKRGVPPERISSSENFDAEEYAKNYGNRIHPDFYSFADHAPGYLVAFPKDDCSVPNLTKSTVKNSLSVKLRTFGSANITCRVCTDQSVHKEFAIIPDSGIDFNDLNFASLSFSNQDFMTFPLAEKEKNWVDKQLSFFSDAFREPFGIYSVTYKFTVKGRIKP